MYLATRLAYCSCSLGAAVNEITQAENQWTIEIHINIGADL